MDRPLTILLVEDDPEDCEMFVRYIDSLTDVQLVAVTNSAEKAIEEARDYLPDAVILDLELHKGSGNGIAFLSAINKTRSSHTPYVLVTTNNISSTTHEQVRLLGADFIMVKSQLDYSAETAVEFLRSLKRILHSPRKKNHGVEQRELSPNEKKKRLLARVSAEIDMIGISPKALGRRYLVDSIMLLADGEEKHISTLAHKYGKSTLSIERAMQNAIGRAWMSGDIDDLHRLYTARITSDKGVPTLTEFVCYYANKLKSEY